MSKVEYPEITVVTVIYNTGKFVVRGLNSLLAQTYPHEKIQHIIVDDSSFDNSVQLIESWLQDHPDHSCSFIKHEKNFGLCRSLNDGLNLAHGKYFAVMADDLWKPERLRICIEEFEKLSEEYALIYTPIDICDEHDTIFLSNQSSNFKLKIKDPVISLLTEGIFVPATSSIYRTSAIKDVGGFDERLTFEDVDLLLRLCRKYTFCFLDQSLSIYRKDVNNFNSLSNKARKSFDWISDMLKMNANALGQSLERDDMLLSAYLDELEIWYLDKYDKEFSLSRAKKHNTLMTRHLLSIYRDKRKWSKYYGRLLSLLLYKKNSPYSLKDIVYLSRKYFDKDFQFY